MSTKKDTNAYRRRRQLDVERLVKLLFWLSRKRVIINTELVDDGINLKLSLAGGKIHTMYFTVSTSAADVIEFCKDFAYPHNLNVPNGKHTVTHRVSMRRNTYLFRPTTGFSRHQISGWAYAGLLESGIAEIEQETDDEC